MASTSGQEDIYGKIIEVSPVGHLRDATIMNEPLPRTVGRVEAASDQPLLFPTSPFQSGEKHRLKSLLKERLVECGWRDAIKDEVRSVLVPVLVVSCHFQQTTKATMRCSLHPQCRKLLKERGYENVTVDQLVKDVVPLGRVMVPDRCATGLAIRPSVTFPLGRRSWLRLLGPGPSVGGPFRANPHCVVGASPPVSGSVAARTPRRALERRHS